MPAIPIGEPLTNHVPPMNSAAYILPLPPRTVNSCGDSECTCATQGENRVFLAAERTKGWGWREGARRLKVRDLKFEIREADLLD